MCAAQASSGNFTVYDRRDNKPYTVRYAGGRCWMTSDLTISGTVYSTDSNFSNVSSWNLNAASGKSYTQAVSSGGTYNFCSATAGNGNGCTMYDSYYGDNDICPAGWRLPSIGEVSQISSNPDIVNSLSGNCWTNESTGRWEWGAADFGAADGSMLQCVFYRNGNNVSLSGDTSNCRNGSSHYGNIRYALNRIRCVRK